MSETEHYKGTITKIASGREESEKLAKELMLKAGKDTLPRHCDNWIEYLWEENYGEYVSVDNDLYSVEREDITDQDVTVAHKIDNGYSFQVQYYNGGTSFDEAIQEAVDKANE